MLFLLGSLGLLQLTVLPGTVWLSAVGARPRNVPEAVLYPFAISLVLNYLLVVALVICHAHYRGAWLAIILAELAALCFMYVRRGSHRVPLSWAPARAPSVAAALALVAVLALVPLIWENWGSVYTSNDDVASWDRWAQEWAGNLVPAGMKLYPQLLPTNWSVTYALCGTAQVKMFGKAIMPLFPLGIVLTFVAMARQRCDPRHYFGAMFASFFLLVYLGPSFLMTGYTDVASAFFAILSYYALTTRSGSGAPRPPADSESNLSGGQRPSLANALALLFGAGSALAKQGGLLIFGAVLTWNLARPGKRNQGSIDWIPLLTAAVISGSTIAWFGMQIYAAYSGAEASNIKFLTMDIHAGRGLLERILYASRLLMSRGGSFGSLFFWIAAALVSGGLLLPGTRALVAMGVIPGFLLWGALFGYETRTAAILFPFAALAAGLVLGTALAPLAEWSRTRMTWHHSHRGLAIALVLSGIALCLQFGGSGTMALAAVYFWPMMTAAAFYAAADGIRPAGDPPVFHLRLPALAMSLAVLAVAAGVVRYPTQELLKQQLLEQRAIGKPRVNARLYQLYEAGSMNDPVISNYWYLGSLPELSPLNRLLTCGSNCSVENVLRDIQLTADAQYLLLEDLFLPPSTVRKIGFCGGLEQVFSEGTVRLFRVHRDKFQADPAACRADPELSRPVIRKLYPPITLAGTGFNVQPDGNSALGVECKNASQSSVVYWNGAPLESAFGGADAVSALVPPKLYSQRGKNVIEVHDRETGLRSSPVYFEVR